jgi:hypothetical protein
VFIAQPQTAGTSVKELLSAPDLSSLELLAGDADRVVRSVRIVPEQRVLRELTADELAVVLPAVFAEAQGHQFDVALRDTSATGAAGVVLTGVAARRAGPPRAEGVRTELAGR